MSVRRHFASPSFRGLLGLGVALAMAAAGRAAEAGGDSLPVSRDYVLKVWAVGDGLPSNMVNAVVQAADDYLWIGTSGGLARFDGRTFTTVATAGIPALGTNEISALRSTPEGDLWLGVRGGGIARLRAGKIEPIVPVSTPLISPSSIARDAAGAIWYAVYPTLEVGRWKDGKLSVFGGRNGLGPGASPFVCASADGKIWFSTTLAAGIFEAGKWRRLDWASGLEVRLAPARDGGMWVVRDLKLLRGRPDGTCEERADLGWLKRGNQINLLFESRDGDLWIGTRGMGLIRYHEGGFTRVPTSHANVMAIAEDRDGNLWVGTHGGGLNRLRRTFFSTRQVADGLRNEAVYALTEDSQRRLIVVGFDDSVARATDSTNRAFTPFFGLPFEKGTNPQTVCADPAGGFWLGGLSGVIRWRDDAFRAESPAVPITSLQLDRRRNLWAATINRGLIRVRDGAVEPVPTAGGLFEPRALAEDRSGKIWVGTEAGLVFRECSGPGAPGLPAFAPVALPGAQGGPIRFLVAEETGDVWIGAAEALYRWRDGRVAILPGVDAEFGGDLRALGIDRTGNLWLAARQGLFRISRDQADAALENGSAVKFASYGLEDGLPNLEFAYGFRGSPVRTHDGHLWFASTRGALEISPEDPPRGSPLSPVVIEQVRVGDTVLPRDGSGLVLGPLPAPLEIRYTVPRLTAPEQLRFRYRLVGLGDTWIRAGEQRVVTFPGLRPGSYRFEVAAEDRSLATSLTSLAFTVRAAWWQTAIFRVAGALAGLAALAGLVRWQERRRARARLDEWKQKHAVELERIRISRDMHDDLGASLTRIALMSELAARQPGADALRPRLGQVAETARAASAALDEIVWAVNPRNDTLKHLVGYIADFARDYLRPADLPLDLDLPPDLPDRAVSSQVRHEVLLATKEALNNLVKTSGARHVSLRITLDAQALRITLADDGRGFDPADVPPGSNGLVNMRQRLEMLGGSARIDSRLGEGTTVTFLIPIPALA